MRDRTPKRRARRGFTLLEVMIALSILVVSLFILMETQGTAALMTIESERMMTATQLAQDKLAEVQFLVENEGFQQQDVHEEGDFDDFGDEALDIEFSELSSYHYEFLVTEIDLGLGGDLAGMMASLQEQFAPEGGAGAGAAMNMGGLPISEEMITEMLNPFIREVRVRVWWGDDLEDAEDLGNEVVLTTHMIQPNANLLSAAGLGGLGGAGGLGAAGAAGMQGARPGRAGRAPRRGAGAAAGWWGPSSFQGFGMGSGMPAAPGGGMGRPASSPTAPTRTFNRGSTGGKR